MLNPVRKLSVLIGVTLLTVSAAVTVLSQEQPKAVPYLKLTAPRHVLPDAQKWEGNEFPHTMSVLELNRGGFRYWGWYGLNEGRGIGLARSNDLVTWTKYDQNPLWTNARWPTVLAGADPKQKDLLYFAITRDYDTSSSRVVLATSVDGIHLTEVKGLIAGVPDQRNQNPNLFRDPRTGTVLSHFLSRQRQGSLRDRQQERRFRSRPGQGPGKVLLKSTTTVAAPTLLYLKDAMNASGKRAGVYYMATEVYPHRYSDDPEGEWQVKVFAADSPDGDFQPVEGNPIMSGQRACLFQHVFNDHFMATTVT